jgi:hypothetical protein
MNIFSQFGLISKNIEIKDNILKLTFNHYGRDFSIDINTDNFKLETKVENYNNNIIYEILKLSLKSYEDLSISNFFILEKNINISNISFKYKKEGFNLNINWNEVDFFEKIEIPNYENHFISTYLDKTTLKMFLKEHEIKKDNLEEKLTIEMFINLYINTVLANRFLYVFTLIQSYISMIEISEIKNINLFSKNKLSFSKTVKNKKIKFSIESKLKENYELEVIINAKVNNKNFLLTKDSKINLEYMEDLLSNLFNQKIKIKKHKFLSSDSINSKKFLDIINSRNMKVKEYISLILDYKNLYKNGFHIKYNKNLMEIEEVYFPKEILLKIKKDLLLFI